MLWETCKLIGPQVPYFHSDMGGNVWRARIAPACPQDHESCGDQDPCLERTGIPTGPIWPNIL
eukprot:scaffold31844_cov64-Phaeocystis_antarctica.AAC.6